MDFLYGRTTHRHRVARIGLHTGVEFDYPPLLSAARQLVGTEGAPGSWYLLALAIAEIGVRLKHDEALRWSHELLESEAVMEASRNGTSREYVELSVSVARLDESQLSRVLEILPATLLHFEESGDFELARPLLRAYELIGDARRISQFRSVLEAAGSEHPDVVAYNRL
jgi:hypothetical protein